MVARVNEPEVAAVLNFTTACPNERFKFTLFEFFYSIAFTFSPLWSKKQVLEEIKVILKSSFEKNGTIWGRTNNLSEELSAWLIMVIFLVRVVG